MLLEKNVRDKTPLVYMEETNYEVGDVVYLQLVSIDLKCGLEIVDWEYHA